LECYGQSESASVVSSDHVKPGQTISIGEAPTETYKERFKRVLAFCEEHRPLGIIEIVLATNNNDQVTRWVPVIKKAGFKLVSPKEGVKNGNSANLLYVYHKYSGHKEPQKGK
jgi:hypothetical protein